MDDGICAGRATFAGVQPICRSAVYVNDLAAEERGPGQGRLGANYARLAELKAQYDPDELFRLNQNIQARLRLAGRRHGD